MIVRLLVIDSIFKTISQTYGGFGDSVCYEWQEPDGVTYKWRAASPGASVWTVKHEITTAREGSGKVPPLRNVENSYKTWNSAIQCNLLVTFSGNIQCDSQPIIDDMFLAYVHFKTVKHSMARPVASLKTAGHRSQVMGHRNDPY